MKSNISLSQQNSISTCTAAAPRAGRDRKRPSIGAARGRNHSERPTPISAPSIARSRPHTAHGPEGARGATIMTPRGRTAMQLQSRDTRAATPLSGPDWSCAPSSTRGRRGHPQPRHTLSVVRCDGSWAPVGQHTTCTVWAGGWMAGSWQALAAYLQRPSAWPDPLAQQPRRSPVMRR